MGYIYSCPRQQNHANHILVKKLAPKNDFSGGSELLAECFTGACHGGGCWTAAAGHVWIGSCVGGGLCLIVKGEVVKAEDLRVCGVYEERRDRRGRGGFIYSFDHSLVMTE